MYLAETIGLSDNSNDRQLQDLFLRNCALAAHSLLVCKYTRPYTCQAKRRATITDEVWDQDGATLRILRTCTSSGQGRFKAWHRAHALRQMVS